MALVERGLCNFIKKMIALAADDKCQLKTSFKFDPLDKIFPGAKF